MKSFNYIITDPVGIHARPAGLPAKEAKNVGDAVITVTKDGKTMKASQLMMLRKFKGYIGPQDTHRTDDRAPDPVRINITLSVPIAFISPSDTYKYRIT